MLEELVCASLIAIAELRIALPACPAAQGEGYITIPGPLFRSEVHRSKLGVAIAVTVGRLKMSRSCRVAPEFITPVHDRIDTSNSSADETNLPRQLPRFLLAVRKRKTKIRGRTGLNQPQMLKSLGNSILPASASASRYMLRIHRSGAASPLGWRRATRGSRFRIRAPRAR